MPTARRYAAPVTARSGWDCRHPPTAEYRCGGAEHRLRGCPPALGPGSPRFTAGRGLGRRLRRTRAREGPAGCAQRALTLHLLLPSGRPRGYRHRSTRRCRRSDPVRHGSLRRLSVADRRTQIRDGCRAVRLPSSRVVSRLAFASCELRRTINKFDGVLCESHFRKADKADSQLAMSPLHGVTHFTASTRVLPVYRRL